MSLSAPRLAIILPCYNEESMLNHTFNALLSYLRRLIKEGLISTESFLYFVDDGSSDKSWTLISNMHNQTNQIKGLKLTRNFGHQNAILAGMLQVQDKVDCLITIDADLQDDINAIRSMLTHYQEGYDIVCGVRKSRQKDSLFKRLSASLFYRTLKLLNIHTIAQHADFRLLSRRVLKKLQTYEERNLYLRGIIPSMGYKTALVHYNRTHRPFGSSKYSLRKMISLALDAVTSFTHKPLDYILFFGALSFLFSCLMIIWVLTAKIHQLTVPGWASIMIPLCFMGGIQLLSIGILGEYIAKIYIEVKRRPRYLEEEELF